METTRSIENFVSKHSSISFYILYLFYFVYFFELKQDALKRSHPSPRQGWASPTYEEILDRKRKEERSYRKFNDNDGDGRIGGANYMTTSMSDGHINKLFEVNKNNIVVILINELLTLFISLRMMNENSGIQTENTSQSKHTKLFK